MKMETPPALLAALGESDMADLEQRFVEEYCVDLNHKRAAERCGVTADKSAALGRRFLRKPEVMQAIDVRLAELSKVSVVNAEWVRVKLKEVVDRCMQAVPVMISQRNEDGKMEQVPSGEFKFDSGGANKALENLGKHLGMFTEHSVLTIEHELKSLPQHELDARIARLQEEFSSVTMLPGADGVYAAEAAKALTSNPQIGGEEIQETLPDHVEEKLEEPQELQTPLAEPA